MVRTILALLIAAPLLGCSSDSDDHHDRASARPAGYRVHRDSDWDRNHRDWDRDWDRNHRDWDRHDLDRDRYDYDRDVYRDQD